VARFPAWARRGGPWKSSGRAAVGPPTSFTASAPCSKEGSVTRTATDVNQLLREVLVLAQDEIQKRLIVVETRLDVRLPTVIADRVQLQQVIFNLITNAAEAMDTVNDRPRVLRLRRDLVADGNVAPDHPAGRCRIARKRLRREPRPEHEAVGARGARGDAKAERDASIHRPGRDQAVLALTAACCPELGRVPPSSHLSFVEVAQ
jgi:hypothetical protein